MTGAVTVDSAPVVEVVVGVEPVTVAVTLGRGCVTRAVSVDNAPSVVAGLVGVIVLVTPLVGEFVVELVERVAKLLVGAELASGAVVAERVCLTGAVTVDTAPVLVVGVVELVARALELGVVELLVGAEVEVFEVTVGVLELVVEELEPLVGVPELVGVPVLVVEVIDVMVGVLELVVEALKPLVGVP